MDQLEMNQIKAEKGFMHHIESFGAVDGPGIRFVFFLQGCSLRCLYCHNPDAITQRGGKVWTADEAVHEVLRYRNYIRDGGVTFSGGEPLLQSEFVHATSVLLRKEGIHVAIDTAGCIPVEHAKAAIDEADLILLDIKAADTALCQKITGRGNEHAFALLDYCEMVGKPVWVRHVLLRGYTLLKEHLIHLAKRLMPYRCIQRVELLPFHKLGEPKWEEIGLQYQLKEIPATTQEEVVAGMKVFRSYGFSVQ